MQFKNNKIFISLFFMMIAACFKVEATKNELIENDREINIKSSKIVVNGEDIPSKDWDYKLAVILFVLPSQSMINDDRVNLGAKKKNIKIKDNILCLNVWYTRNSSYHYLPEIKLEGEGKYYGIHIYMTGQGKESKCKANVFQMSELGF